MVVLQRKLRLRMPFDCTRGKKRTAENSLDPGSSIFARIVHAIVLRAKPFSHQLMQTLYNSTGLASTRTTPLALTCLHTNAYSVNAPERKRVPVPEERAELGHFTRNAVGTSRARRPRLSLRCARAGSSSVVMGKTAWITRLCC